MVNRFFDNTSERLLRRPLAQLLDDHPLVRILLDAFGKVTSQTNPAVDSLFLFTVWPFDAETKQEENLPQKFFGQQSTPKNLNRWYDARVGRWLSEDPIGFEPGDGNIYRNLANAKLG